VLFGFLIFFPILWMILTSFKTELDAFATPPSFLFLPLDHRELRRRSRSAAIMFIMRFNSIVIAGASTLDRDADPRVPAAWSMAFGATKRTKDILLWMLSTKMMPPVGGLVPIYLDLPRSACSLARRTDFHPVPRQSSDRVWMLFNLFQESRRISWRRRGWTGATIGRELVMC